MLGAKFSLKYLNVMPTFMHLHEKQYLGRTETVIKCFLKVLGIHCEIGLLSHPV